MIANMQKELDFCIGIQDDTFNSTVLYENIFRNMGLEQCYTTETFKDDFKKSKKESECKGCKSVEYTYLMWFQNQLHSYSSKSKFFNKLTLEEITVKVKKCG